MEAEDIVRLREELGVSQAELAHRLEVPQATVDRWETGLSTPTGAVLGRLQRLLRFKDFQSDGRLISLRALLGGEVTEEEPEGLPPWHEDADHVPSGHLSLIVSPPRCGKTLTALRWAYKTCRAHTIPTYYVSTHWSPLQTLRHLESGVEDGDGLDPNLPFQVFQHDGKDLLGLLEELSHSIPGDAGPVFVVVDWLQNLDYVGERFRTEDAKERQLLRDLKTWSTKQKAYVLAIASQRGIATCDQATFPHFFELADSISVGGFLHLKRRQVEFQYQDLHQGGAISFTYDLPEGKGAAPKGRRPHSGPHRALRGVRPVLTD